MTAIKILPPKLPESSFPNLFICLRDSQKKKFVFDINSPQTVSFKHEQRILYISV